MPKLGYLPRSAYMPGVKRNDEGLYSGAEMIPGSVGVATLAENIRELSQITPRMGLVTAGTFIAGTIGTGRVIVGDQASGVIWRDSDEQTIVSITWDGALRLGLVGTPGIDMTAGLLDMHGGAIRAGTIEAVSINLPGDLSSTLLTSDRIQVGSGTWGVDFSGFAISQSAAGGYNNGEQIIMFDNVTGHIVSIDPASVSNTYVNIGSGKIVISNPKAEVSAATEYPSQLIFRSVTTPEEGDPTTEDIGMWADGYGINFVNPDGTGAPRLRLVSDSKTFTELGGGYLNLNDSDGLASMQLSWGASAGLITGTRGLSLEVGAFATDPRITLNPAGGPVDVKLGYIQFTPSSGVWAAQPAASVETRAIIHFDSVNKRWQTEIDGAWYYFNVTAV